MPADRSASRGRSVGAHMGRSSMGGAAILEVIRQRVGSGRVCAVAAGVSDAASGPRIAVCGDAGAGQLPLGHGSVFEIGSVTKQPWITFDRDQGGVISGLTFDHFGKRLSGTETS